MAMTLRSGLLGLVTAVAAWMAALAIVGTDEKFVLNGRSISWGIVISVATAALVMVVLVALSRNVEPMLTALAAAAGCVLLYDTRRFPFADDPNLQRTDNNYWTVVAAMIFIFAVLLVSLRMTRRSQRG